MDSGVVFVEVAGRWSARPRELLDNYNIMTSPVLLVDDETDSAFLLERAFRKAEVTNPLHAIEDATLAMDYLAQAADGSAGARCPLPSIVLLDLKMPRMPGLEVLKWIRGHPVLRPLVVIVFTSSSEQAEIRNAYRAGANSYLVKPTSITLLTDLVRDIHSYWLRHNRPPLE